VVGDEPVESTLDAGGDVDSDGGFNLFSASFFIFYIAHRLLDTQTQTVPLSEPCQAAVSVIAE